MGLEGKTPAEAAGITIAGRDKWLTVIQKATAKKIDDSEVVRH
jgi:hypothetical protein